MTSQTNRRTLMGSAAITAAGVAALTAFSAPASAQGCTYIATNIPGDTCVYSSTSTTNTVSPTNAPLDRVYERNFGFSQPTFFIVGPGVIASGFGLAVTQVDASANTLVFNNDGTIAVDVGNTASAGGGSGALFLNATEGSIYYYGSGNVINQGTGDALVLISNSATGAGSLGADIGGSVQANAGTAIGAVSLNAASTGAVVINTATGQTVRASAGDGILVSAAGSGDIIVNNSAAISSAAAGANTLQNGITATSTGTGDVAVYGNGAIGTSGDRAQLLGLSATVNNAVSDGNVTINTSGDIYSLGTAVTGTTNGTGDVDIETNGVANSTNGAGIVGTSTTGTLDVRAFDNVSAGGIGIDAATTSGNLTIQSTGTLAAAGTGIEATTTGGTVDVTTSGTVTSNGGAAITASSAAGNQMLTIGAAVTGATDGIVATNTGTQQIIVNGNVTGTSGTGISSTTTGTRMITIGSGRTVSGGTQAVLLAGTGATTLGNAGTIGTASTGLALNAAGAGAVTLNNNTTGIVNGRLTFGAGADTFANQGTFNTQGTTDFGGGADTLTNTGTINLTGATTFSNLETFNLGGALNLNTFVLTGSGALTNTGTIDTNGAAGLAGFTTFNNAGVLNLAPGPFTASGAFTNSGTIFADEGVSSITGQTSFTNSGTIDLQDGVIGDVLTINSSFAGTGGSTLLLDVDDDASDQLIITGAASGSTSIDANLIGTGILIADGVLLVDAGTSAAGAFTLGGVTGNTNPLLDYGLEQRDADYYLVTSINAAGFAPLPVSLVANELWYQSADAVIAQAKLPDDGTGRMGIWGQVYFGRERSGGVDTQTVNGIDADVDNKLHTDRVGLQAGYGFGLGGMGTVGLTAGIEESDSTTDSNDYEAHGWNVGAYGVFGGPVGIHGSLLAKHDRFDIDMNSGLFRDLGPDAQSNGVDGEIGYKLGGGGSMSIDVSAGLSHVRTKIDDIELEGLTYDFDRMTSTRGRFGVRATGSGPISPFVDARLFHEFSGDGDLTLTDGIDGYRLSADGRGTWARIEAGVGGPASGLAPMVSAWVDLGDVKGVGARGSFRF